MNKQEEQENVEDGAENAKTEEENVKVEEKLDLQPFYDEMGKWFEKTHELTNFQLHMYTAALVIFYPLSAYGFIFYALYQFFQAYQRSKDQIWKKVRIEEVEE